MPLINDLSAPHSLPLCEREIDGNNLLIVSLDYLFTKNFINKTNASTAHAKDTFRTFAAISYFYFDFAHIKNNNERPKWLAANPSRNFNFMYNNIINT